MKAYTDIEQSRKLAEILPIESADMCYRAYKEEGGILDYGVTLCPYQFASWIGVPCWSLAALLEVLPLGKILLHDKETKKYRLIYTIDTAFHDSPVDACVEMIFKLKENNLL